MLHPPKVVEAEVHPKKCHGPVVLGVAEAVARVPLHHLAADQTKGGSQKNQCPRLIHQTQTVTWIAKKKIIHTIMMAIHVKHMIVQDQAQTRSHG